MNYKRIVAIVIVLLFVVLGIHNIVDNQNKVHLKNIQLKSTSTKLKALEKQYDQLEKDNKSTTEQQQQKLQELEKQKADLEKQLSLKKAKLQMASTNIPGTGTASAASTGASGCVFGYTTSNYALNQLIAHESGGKGSCATNAGGCYGLLQACPGAPLRAACGGNPECQIDWFIRNKTGGRSWEAIWALWQTQGWW